MAFFKGSYYETLAPFDSPQDGSRGFRGVRPRPVPAAEPVLEHPVAVSDRLDGLGHHYYANPRDWRRIADANPETLFAEDLIVEPAPDDALDPGSPTGDEAASLRERLGAIVLVPRRREGTR